MIASEPSKKGISISYSTLGPWDVHAVGFPRLVLLRGLISPVQIPKAGVMDGGHQLLLLQRGSCLWDPSLLYVDTPGVGFSQNCLCLSYTLNMILLSFDVESCSSRFQR